jgi:prepilin-type N-terminal cleavage/methylation domain-containing protein
MTIPYLKRNQSGFTIVELLIVIVIIGILAAITVVAYNNIQQRGRDAQRMQDLADTAKALHLHYIGNGQGWFNGGSPTVLKFLQDAGYLTGKNVRDPRCNAGEVSGCSGYLKINCGTEKTILLARLEGQASGQPLPSALTGCDNTSYWSTYQMNYYVVAG